MAGLGTSLAGVVNEHFLDRSFVASAAWDELAARLSSLDNMAPDRFQDNAQRLLDRLPLSHVQLLSPQQCAQQEAGRQGDTPEPLRMVWRHGAGWFYLRLPSFTIPAFTLDQFLAAAHDVHDDETLVIDLRLNAGGSLSCAGEVLGALLGPDVPYARTDLDDRSTSGGRREVRPFAEATNRDHGADVGAVRSG